MKFGLSLVLCAIAGFLIRTGMDTGNPVLFCIGFITLYTAYVSQ